MSRGWLVKKPARWVEDSNRDYAPRSLRDPCNSYSSPRDSFSLRIRANGKTLSAAFKRPLRPAPSSRREIAGSLSMMLVLFTNTVCGIGKSTLAEAIRNSAPEGSVCVVIKDEVYRSVVGANPNETKARIRALVNEETANQIGEASRKLVGLGHGRRGVIILDRNMVNISPLEVRRFCVHSVRPLRLFTVGFDWAPSRDGYFLPEPRRSDGFKLTELAAAELLLVMCSACRRSAENDRGMEDTIRAFQKFWLDGKVSYTMPVHVSVPVWKDEINCAAKRLADSVGEFLGSRSPTWTLASDYLRHRTAIEDPVNPHDATNFSDGARADPTKNAEMVLRKLQQFEPLV